MNKQVRSRASNITAFRLGVLILAVVTVLGVAGNSIREQWTSPGAVEAQPPVNPAPGSPPEIWGPHGARYVVIADSTAALGEKANVLGSSNKCVHSGDAWPGKLRQLTGWSVGDWSCSSATTSDGLVAVSEAPIGSDTRWVLVTLGSNDFSRPKSEPSPEGVRKNLTEIVRVAKSRGGSGTGVAFVDYLGFDDKGCPETLRTARAGRITRAHDFANRVFRSVKGATVVSMPRIPGLCSPGSVISLPGSGRGVAWHNLGAAHDLVVGAVVSGLRLPMG